MRLPLLLTFLTPIFLAPAPLAAQTAFVTGSGYVAPPAIFVAPGQIATFFVGGLPQSAAALKSTVAVLSVGGVTETAAVLSAKPVNPSMLAITAQLPFDLTPEATAPVTIQFAQTDSPQSDLCAQNACTAPVSLSVAGVLPHIITTCDVFYSTASSACQLAITHQNGSLVTYAAPAKAGEILTIWALGLGVPAGGIPAAASGPIAMNDITLQTSFAVIPSDVPATYDLSSPTPYLWAGLPSPSTGLYQINFAVPALPANLQSCTASTEWFTGSGNLFVSVFRVSIATSQTPVLRSFTFTTVISPGDAPSSICVSQ
jgi:uncharacterized protein (TIGR03437 family)